MKTKVRANWSHVVLVCKKCSKKLDRKGRGFGPEDKRLAAALKHALGAGKTRKSRIGVIEVPCLDICPKGGVVTVDSRRPEEWRIVDPDGDFAAEVDLLR
jgi:predicted metal-binding protein